MNIIIWLVVGGLIGWVASLIMRTDAQQGIILNVVVGIVGALEIAVRNGKKFARFTAKVTAVGPDAVKVRFLTSAGNPEREISLKPGPNAFWVPERQLGIISDPDDTAASTIILN